ncbi:MAG: S46 family peptidase [Candidatus Cryptobacteroides sp.]
MRNYLSAILLFAVFSILPASADEGMWLIQDINSALEKKMQERGLRLSAGEIYNADAPGSTVSDAVVSLGFYCTGSIISDEGLMITNHHCAYSDIFSMSTPEHNYLEEGYWAALREDEKPIPDKEVFFLKRVIDVTAETEALKEELKSEGKPFGMRKLSYVLEKKYSEDTGLEAFLSSMWSGEKYYIALYQIYTDLRLVAAPPVSVAAFGGDVDNWEWPQQKCDFAMYRIYTAPDGSPADYSPENVPLRPVRKLEISLEGYKPGDFTMVIGYPGRTNRYSSSMETDYEERVALPIANKLRIRQMAIMKKWMDSDPDIWLKYSDIYFGLSNVGEMQEGEEACLKRFGAIRSKAAEEAELQSWIEASPDRKAKWGDLLNELRERYKASENVEINKAYYRETMFRGTIISRTIMRMNSTRAGYDAMKKHLERGLKETDPRVEKELLRYAVEQYFSNVDPSFFGPYQKELLERFGNDFDSMVDYVWEGSYVTSTENAAKFTEESQFEEDRLRKLLTDVGILAFNKAENNQEHRSKILELQKEYTYALYEMREERCIPQYPDANSTMRISYGTVGTLSPRDGVECSWQSSSTGIEEKYCPSNRDYRPSDKFMGLIHNRDWGRWCGKCAKIPVNFLTDNDITGGNSGSPVLDAEGRLIGLAFDGNKESLASDLYYTPDYNKCVCVDIRYILWTLDRYAGMHRIVEELGL